MSKHCPNCKGPLQDFRPANDDEKKYLVEEEKLTWADAHSFWRCQGHEGACRWVQPHLSQGKGLTLPERFA